MAFTYLLSLAAGVVVGVMITTIFVAAADKARMKSEASKQDKN